MAIEWSRTLSTGVAWQDRQHRELFKRINSLLDAVTVGLGKEESSRLLRFLEDYIVVHFEAEEQAMHRFNYHATLEHLAMHTAFIDEVGRLRSEFASTPTSALVIKIQRVVIDWLIKHIGGEDKVLGSFMLNADKPSSNDKGKV